MDKQSQLLKIKDVSNEFCQTAKDHYIFRMKYYELLRQNSSEEEDVEEAFHEMTLYHFEYLYLKYQYFYFSDINIEKIYRKYRPAYEMFNPYDFEHLVGTMLYLIEGCIYQTTKGSHDKGIDLVHETILYSETEAFGTMRNIVQCKLYRSTIPVVEIRDFFGVMTAEVAEGYFFTTGELTRSGNQFVDTARNSPWANKLHIVDNSKFKILLKYTSMISNCWQQIGELDPDTTTFDDDFDFFWEYKTKLQSQAKALIRQHKLVPPTQLSLL